MDYEKDLKSVGKIGADVSFEPPTLQIPYQEGISERSKISYKQGVAFKPLFKKITINTAVPATFEFWAPENFNINPN